MLDQQGNQCMRTHQASLWQRQMFQEDMVKVPW
jgi:hypothetical protein